MSDYNKNGFILVVILIMKKPIISYKFVNMEESEKETVIALVEKNIDLKLWSYLQKVTGQNEDVEVRLKYTLMKNKKKLFDWSFILSYSGGKDMVYIRDDFHVLADLVNHAFDHFKLEFSS